MYRVEDKYCLSDNELDILEHRVGTILKADRDVKGYTVSSLYFDDLRNSNYIQSLDGNPERTKYRIRIYNNSFDTIKLEVKRKRYNRAIKYVSEISIEETQCLLRGDEIDDRNGADRSRFLFNMGIKRASLRPRVIVTYDRNAYVHEEGNCRITFDRGIRASNYVDLFGQENLTYDYLREGGAVLEVKYDEFIPRILTQTLQGNHMNQTSNSKYVMCYGLYL